MITEPKLEQRRAQPYLGIRTLVSIRTLSRVVPRLLDELRTWMGERDLAGAGAPFVRFHIIRTQTEMDVEMGIPVAGMVPGARPVSAGILPAGKYASLIYTGATNRARGNKALQDWAATRGITWDRWEQANGEAFGARLETYLTDPLGEPAPSTWQTELAIRLADDA